MKKSDPQMEIKAIRIQMPILNFVKVKIRLYKNKIEIFTAERGAWVTALAMVRHCQFDNQSNVFLLLGEFGTRRTLTFRDCDVPTKGFIS